MAVAEDAVVGHRGPEGVVDANRRQLGTVAQTEDRRVDGGGYLGVAQGLDGRRGSGGTEAVGIGGQLHRGDTQGGCPTHRVEGVEVVGSEQGVANEPLFLHVAALAAPHFGPLAVTYKGVGKDDGHRVPLEGTEEVSLLAAAGGSEDFDAHLDLVVAFVGEMVADAVAPQSVQDGAAETVGVDYPSGGVGVGIDIPEAGAPVGEAHVVVAVGHDVCPGQRLAVADIGIDLGDDGLVGVEGRGHLAQESLDGYGVAGIGPLCEDEVVDGGQIKVRGGGGGNLPEGHGVHMGGIENLYLVAPLRRIPRV